MDKINSLINWPPYLDDDDAERMAHKLSADDINTISHECVTYCKNKIDDLVAELKGMGCKAAWKRICELAEQGGN